jgi:hypothetical protein
MKDRNLSTKDLVSKMRNFKSKTNLLKEEVSSADLDIQQDIQDKFKKAISTRIKFIKYEETEDNKFIEAYVPVDSNNKILFKYNFMDGCTLTTDNLKLTDESLEVIEKIYTYYDLWLNGEENEENNANPIGQI